MSGQGLPRLLWISPGDGLGDGLWRTLRAAVRGGLRGFQLREKDCFVRALFDAAPELRRILPREDGGFLVVNDRADVALCSDFDAVQLGHASLPVRATRQLVGASKRIGRSVHNFDELREAEDGDADFVIASPVYPVRKPGLPPSPPLGLRGLREICDATSIPVYALGGIVPERVGEVLAQGVHGVAVQRAIARADDPARVVAEFLRQLEAA